MRTRQRLGWLCAAVCDSGGAPTEPEASFSLPRLYVSDIPALIRFNRWLLLATAGAFFLSILGGAALAEASPQATRAVLNAYAEQIERLGGLEGITTAAILRNNLRVMLLSPLLAMFTLGLYPLLIVVLPGLLVGMLGAHFDAFTPLTVLVGVLLVLPHGVFEIPAIFCGSVLSMRLAWSLFRPVPTLSILENVVWAAANLCKVYAFLVIPLLVIAAWVEVHVTGGIARWLVGLGAISPVP